MAADLFYDEYSVEVGGPPYPGLPPEEWGDGWGGVMQEEQADNIIKTVARYDAACEAMLNVTERTLRGEALDVRDKITVVEEFMAARLALDNAIMTKGLVVV